MGASGTGNEKQVSSSHTYQGLTSTHVEAAVLVMFGAGAGQVSLWVRAGLLWQVVQCAAVVAVVVLLYGQGAVCAAAQGAC